MRTSFVKAVLERMTKMSNEIEELLADLDRLKELEERLAVLKELEKNAEEGS